MRGTRVTPLQAAVELIGWLDRQGAVLSIAEAGHICIDFDAASPRLKADIVKQQELMVAVCSLRQEITSTLRSLDTIH